MKLTIIYIVLCIVVITMPLYASLNTKHMKSNIASWKPDIIDILVSECRRKKAVARKVIYTRREKYRYEPSDEYKRFLAHKIRISSKK